MFSNAIINMRAFVLFIASPLLPTKTGYYKIEEELRLVPMFIRCAFIYV